MKTTFAQYATRTLVAALIAFAMPNLVWGQWDEMKGSFLQYNVSGSFGFTVTEGPAKLLDGSDVTKWCSPTSNKDENNTWHISFEARTAFYPVKYALITGNDNSRYHGRNPKSWKLQAKASESDSWTTIAEESNNYTMENRDFRKYIFDIAPDKINLYLYFRFEISDIQGGDCMQLSELQFYGVYENNANNLEYAIVSGLDDGVFVTSTPENASNTDILNAVKNAIAVKVGRTHLTWDEDYTAEISNNSDNNSWSLTLNSTSSKCTGKWTGTVTVKEAVDLDNSTTTLESKVYKVTGEKTISSRIIVTKNATLILGEGTTLTAQKGIQVSAGNSLTINGTGTLKAAEELDKRLDGAAGIGGNSGETCGTVIINGGNIVSYGQSNGAGIGGGLNGGAGTITINGGTIYAKGYNYAAGIGGGGYNSDDASLTKAGNGGTITINGGTVTAEPGTSNISIGNSGSNYAYAYGIGAGRGKLSDNDGEFGDITITSEVGPATITTESFGGKFTSFGDNREGREISIEKTNGARKGSASTIQLKNRTFIRDGKWNTICLPFSLTKAQFNNSPLKDATDVMKLTEGETTFTDGTLTLNFTSTTPKTTDQDDKVIITAGTPYIIKWENSENNISDPTFKDVTISNNQLTNTVATTSYEGNDNIRISFVGTFSTTELEKDDDKVLFLGAENTLYYPNAKVNVGPFKGYFALDGIVAGKRVGSNNVKSFSLNFNDESGDATSIDALYDPATGTFRETYRTAKVYDLSGRRILPSPTGILPAGLYIVNGKKVAIK